MAICKPAQLTASLANPDPSIDIILVYGSDSGLVSEIADKFANALLNHINPSSEVQRHDIDTLLADPDRLADDYYAVSMFTASKIIRLSGTNRKNLLGALKPLLEQPNKDTKIIIEQSALKKDSALRKTLEKSPNCLVVPCYQDNKLALECLIDEEIVQQGIMISADDRKILLEGLGENRLASRAQLQKLALYAYQSKTLGRNDIISLTGDISAIAVDDIIDSAFTGNYQTISNKLNRLVVQLGSVDPILIMAHRHCMTLHQAKCEMENGATADQTLKIFRPPLHFSRKEKVVQSLRMWGSTSLLQAARKFSDNILEARKNTQLATAMLSATLLAISAQSRRQMQRH